MRHPSTAIGFEWDENNEWKLEQRGIYAEDVEHVFDNEPSFLKNKRSGAARWPMDGRDAAGRRLRICILWGDEDVGTLRAITGWKL